MNYEKTLNKVELFMNKSGIRRFCSETCQGYCCNGCYGSENSCHKTGDRRLACSAFICANLRDILFSPAESRSYVNMMSKIKYELKKLSATNRSVYFKPYTDRVINKFSINKQCLDILDELNVTEINYKLRAIQNIHVVLSRFLEQRLSRCTE